MDCLTRLDYDTDAKKYIGRVFRTGEVRAFDSLPQYQAYAAAQAHCPTLPLPDDTPVQKRPPGSTFYESGFMEFAARDPATQAKYDAMSPQWEGVQASEGAISRGLYALDSGEASKSKTSFVPHKK